MSVWRLALKSDRLAILVGVEYWTANQAWAFPKSVSTAILFLFYFYLLPLMCYNNHVLRPVTSMTSCEHGVPSGGGEVGRGRVAARIGE